MTQPKPSLEESKQKLKRKVKKKRKKKKMEILELFFRKDIAEKIQRNIPGTDTMGRLRRIIDDCMGNKLFMEKVFVINEHTKRLFNITVPEGIDKKTAYYKVIRALYLSYSFSEEGFSIGKIINDGNFITVRKKMNLDKWFDSSKQNKIVLFHGTDLASAMRIKENGIDPNFLFSSSASQNELGFGFYTTSQYEYALKFALIHEYPAMLILSFSTFLQKRKEKEEEINKDDWIRFMNHQISIFNPKFENEELENSLILHNVPVPILSSENSNKIKRVIDLSPTYRQTVFRIIPKDTSIIDLLNICSMQVIYFV